MSRFGYEQHLFWDSSATPNNGILNMPKQFHTLVNPKSLTLLDYAIWGGDATKKYYRLIIKFGDYISYIPNDTASIDNAIIIPITASDTVSSLNTPITLLQNLPLNLNVRKIEATLLNPDGTKAAVTTGMFLRFGITTHTTVMDNIEGRRPTVLDMNAN